MIAGKDLKREIAAIGDLDRYELVARWMAIYRTPPPIGVRRELLRHAVAYGMQSKRLGGLSAETRKTLKLAIAEVAAKLTRPEQTNTGRDDALILAGSTSSRSGDGKPSTPPLRSVPKTGARLIREWNGKTNVVDVVTDGFLFEGKSYRSLTAIAHKITEAHWSGPRFFGL